jgi:hypothetical protein
VKRDLELDFLAVEPRVPRAGAALLVVGLLAAALAAGRFAALRAEARDLARRMEARTPPRALAVAAQGAESGTAADLSRARAVLRRLAAPWDELFAEVEAAVGPDVALLGVQPDLASARVRITGEARTLAQGLAFAARLNRGPALGEAMFSTHEVRVQDPQRPVRFTLEARWKAAEGRR